MMENNDADIKFPREYVLPFDKYIELYIHKKSISSNVESYSGCIDDDLEEE